MDTQPDRLETLRDRAGRLRKAYQKSRTAIGLALDATEALNEVATAHFQAEDIAAGGARLTAAAAGIKTLLDATLLEIDTLTRETT